jgi:segregation and condensation protein B
LTVQIVLVQGRRMDADIPQKPPSDADESPPDLIAASWPADVGDGDAGNEIGSEIDGEIDEAYRRALEAIDNVAPDVPPDAPPLEPLREALAPQSDTVEPAQADAASSDLHPPAPVGPRLAQGTQPHPAENEREPAGVTAEQVIEAALFVGGAPLNAKKICSLLRGSYDTAFVQQAIDELNSQYAAEARPYEIRLGDGGYRMELRPEFDKLRHRVYGSGPREVKLSQDVLEVLALVAYQQPITQEQVESHGKQNAGAVLRQLLRRELIRIERGDGGRKDVRYHTTQRFLSLFGVANLEELPRADDLAVK